MKKAALASASAIAIMLGGCSWIDSHMPGSSSQASTPQYNSSQSSTPSQTPAVAGSSQAPASTATNSSAASTDKMGSDSDKSMHHSMAKNSMGSDRVKEAQQKLKDDGEYQGQVDGKLGPKTASAVKQYQQKNGLKQTGRLDRDTMSKLGVSSTTGSGSSAPSSDSSNSSAAPSTPASPSTPANPPAATPPASQMPAH
jgi:peptidoglycan hydrolase-like protein with peptidoglycan-binding domain